MLDFTQVGQEVGQGAGQEVGQGAASVLGSMASMAASAVTGMASAASSKIWGEPPEIKGWLSNEKILKLYGNGEIYARVATYARENPPINILLRQLCRGECDSIDGDYLRSYYHIFNEKLSTDRSGGYLRSWRTDVMGEMLSLNWNAAASFTNNVYTVAHFANLRLNPGGQNDYKTCNEVLTGGGYADVFHQGHYVSNLLFPHETHPRHTMVIKDHIHRIIKIKGTYLLEGDTLVAKEGIFQAAGGVFSTCSREPTEFEFIVSEGMILVDQIIEKKSRCGRYLFMEISGMYLHHSLILKYLSDYVIRYAHIQGASVEEIKAVLKREDTMELYNTFRDSLVTKRDSHENAEFIEGVIGSASRGGVASGSRTPPKINPEILKVARVAGVDPKTAEIVLLANDMDVASAIDYIVKEKERGGWVSATAPAAKAAATPSGVRAEPVHSGAATPSGGWAGSDHSGAAAPSSVWVGKGHSGASATPSGIEHAGI